MDRNVGPAEALAALVAGALVVVLGGLLLGPVGALLFFLMAVVLAAVLYL